MDELQIFECEQGSEDWHACRAGVITASEFDCVLAKGKGGAPSKTRRTYMLKLAGERLTGQASQIWNGNGHTERGHAMEPEARDLYAFQTDQEPTPVGFMKRGLAGCSPDSLISEDGLLEVKTKLPHLQLEVLLSQEVPSEHVPQIQGQMWVSGRQYVDFVSYWPKLPLFVKRVYRDEAYIDRLAKAVEEFEQELREIVERFAHA